MMAGLFFSLKKAQGGVFNHTCRERYKTSVACYSRALCSVYTDKFALFKLDFPRSPLCSIPRLITGCPSLYFWSHNSSKGTKDGLNLFSVDTLHLQFQSKSCHFWSNPLAQPMIKRNVIIGSAFIFRTDLYIRTSRRGKSCMHGEQRF